MTVAVEVVLLSVSPDDGVAFRIVSTEPPAGDAPDETALRLSGLTGAAEEGAVSHAASWRFEHPATLVLTYTALPDPQPGGAEPLASPSVVCSGDPLRPGPEALHGHHVAAHGARHLAYLAQSDPAVRAAAYCAPGAWRALALAVEGLPVAEHEQAHALARHWTRSLSP